MSGSAVDNVRSLLLLLRTQQRAVEADIQRFYGVDYRDRWRFDGNGRRRLTLRRLWVLVTYLPPESAIVAAARDGAPHWSVEAHLLDDLRIVLTGSKEKPASPHPMRPKPRSDRANPARRAKQLAAARDRLRERRRRIEAGEIT